MAAYLKFIRESRIAVMVLSVITIGMICIADFFSGSELSFSIFYLIPISFGSWYGGDFIGILLSFLGASLWLWADIAAGHDYSHAAIPVWNGMVRLILFLVICGLQGKIKHQMSIEEKLADTDPLTGLANRRSFIERVGFEIERAKRYHRNLTLAYIDLDNFKKVNDTKGHDEGDRLLCLVSSVLLKNLRHTDIIARMGGDEFAILLSETGYNAAEEAMKKCWKRLLETMDENDWPVTFSVGVITFDKPIDNIKEMIKLADDLMYDMKKNGKNRMKHMLGYDANKGAENENVQKGA